MTSSSNDTFYLAESLKFLILHNTTQKNGNSNFKTILNADIRHNCARKRVQEIPLLSCLLLNSTKSEYAFENLFLFLFYFLIFSITKRTHLKLCSLYNKCGSMCAVLDYVIRNVIHSVIYLLPFGP